MNKFLYILTGTIILIGLIQAYNLYNSIKIIAQFAELEPFNKCLPVYYKGYKLGHSGKIYPSSDFSFINVDIFLKNKNFRIPDNAVIKVKSKNKNDYLELIYPSKPSLIYLKNNSKIKGEKSLDISSYISKQAESGGLDEIKDNLNNTVKSAGDTLDALTEFINTANAILVDVRPSVTESSKNLADTTKNLSEITNELNKSMQPARLTKTIVNIEKSTENLEKSTKNLVDLTHHTNGKTISLIDCAITNINTVIKNINDIINGVKNTLNKRFGGMKMIFGKPIN